MDRPCSYCLVAARSRVACGAAGHQQLPQSCSPAHLPLASTLAGLSPQRSRSLHWSSLNFTRLLLAHPSSSTGPRGGEPCCCCSWNDFTNLVHALESLQCISEVSSRVGWFSEVKLASSGWEASQAISHRFSVAVFFDLYYYFVNATF